MFTIAPLVVFCHAPSSHCILTSPPIVWPHCKHMVLIYYYFDTDKSRHGAGIIHNIWIKRKIIHVRCQYQYLFLQMHITFLSNWAVYFFPHHTHLIFYFWLSIFCCILKYYYFIIFCYSLDTFGIDLRIKERF